MNVIVKGRFGVTKKDVCMSLLKRVYGVKVRRVVTGEIENVFSCHRQGELFRSA